MSKAKDLELAILRNLLAQTTRAYDEQVAQLFAEKELAQVTLASIGDAVVTTDASGTVTYLNPVAEDMTGWSSQEARGKPLGSVLNLVGENGESVELDLRPALREGHELNVSEHCSLVDRKGNHVAIDSNASAIRDRRQRVIGLVFVFQDVSEKRLLSLQLTRAARYDSLTGLLNREAFEAHLDHALEDCRTNGTSHVVCFMDLDRFKVVNDTCGHPAGDQLLQWIASLIRERVRDTDVFARLGGDEFGLLLPDCPPEAAKRIAESIHRALHSYRFVWQEEQFSVGISIGLVPISDQFTDLTDLLSAADHACYMAKEKGRRRTQVFQADDLEIRHHHGQMKWVLRIQRALDDDRFALYWQPIQPLAPGKGPAKLYFEVLLRLEDEEGHVQGPSQFLPVAERYGQMAAIDQWVVRHTFDLLEGQPKEFLDALGFCSINLSGDSLGDEGLLELIEERLAKSGVPAGKICFEITETTAVRQLRAAVRMIERLSALHCRWALDDFGSGMSSYSYLRELPVDYLKIDGNIVSDVVTNPLNREMVRSINQIGHVMSLETIAESVTSESVLATLQEIGVDFAQGFGIERPRPIRRREPIPLSSIAALLQ